MQLFVHLLRHPGDGLSLLEQQLPSESRSGLIWGFHSAALGTVPKGSSPSSGLANWLAGRPRLTSELWKVGAPSASKPSQKKRPAVVAVPLVLGSERDGMAEALDRLRRDAHAEVDSWHLALPLETRLEALPRFEDGDRVAVYWEVNDILTGGLAGHLQCLSDHLEEVGGPQLELRLYSRWMDPSSDRLQAICHHLGCSAPSTIPTAKEATWRIL